MQSLRHAFRTVRAAPGVSAAAVLSLALGIGANTAIFSILNSLLLKPLPVHEPERLVVLGSADAAQDQAISDPVWKAIRTHRVFDRSFAWATDRVNVSATAETSFAEAIWATGEFFEVLGVRPLVGRTFTGEDAGAVAVISSRFGHRQFGGAAEAVGRPLPVEGVPFTVIGVAPPDFFGVNVGTAFDVVLPLEAERLLGRVPARLDNAYWPWLRIMARLAPGETAEQLTASLRRVQPLIREATMPGYGDAKERDRYLTALWQVNPAPGGVSRFRRQYGPALGTLLWVVTLVLLIACANVAMLMLARAAARRYEFSVRLALGASRVRLARQLLTESLMLSVAGAALGLAVAYWGSRILVRQLSTWAYTAVLDLSLDWRVLSVTAATTVGTAVLFGTAPALRAARAEPNDALKRTPASAGARRLSMVEGLVIVQVAIALVLVVGAGLFLRSFVALAYRDLGFDRDRLLVAIVDLKRSALPPERRIALYERLSEAAAAVPGVESAAVSMATPLGSAGVRMTPSVVVPASTAAAEPVRILANPVTPGWFRTYGTRLLAGRDFDSGDRGGAPHVAIVNEAFVARYFDGANPIGRTILEEAEGEQRRPWEIVGVVENAAFTSVREAVEPTIYRPLAQAADDKLVRGFPTISLSIRAVHDSPARLTQRVAAAIADVDGGISVSFQTLGQHLDVYYIRERLLAVISGFFGLFAVLLAAVGLYGTMADAVSRRRIEIGLRMALGAAPSAVIGMVLRRATLLALAGTAGGVLASWWAATSVGALLYAVPARDVATFGISAGVLAGVATVAAWVPARRAARIDPAVLLRDT